MQRFGKESLGKPACTPHFLKGHLRKHRFCLCHGARLRFRRQGAHEVLEFFSHG